MLIELLALKEINKPPELPEPKPEPPIVKEIKKPKPKPKLYKIVKGDTIQKIAKKHRQPVRRVLCANPKIVNPDLIYPSDTIKIPYKGQKLKCPKNKSKGISVKSANHSIAPSGGNTYQAGQCVWHVKNLKPEIPNGWGSAYQWLDNAQASGWSTGSRPRVGAVGVRGNHVVYVLKVKANQVLISEMNYDWVPYHQREVWKSASDYSYIY